MARALFIGRFQPFHHGHYEVIKKLLKLHEELIIVIGSSESPISEKNPFTADERKLMIIRSFNESELSRITIAFVPDINDHSRWVAHVKSHVPEFDIVYSNNEIVTKLFAEAKIVVKPIEFIDRGNNEGKYIRKLICEENPVWIKHVPAGVLEYIESIKGSRRIVKLSKK